MRIKNTEELINTLTEISSTSIELQTAMLNGQEVMKKIGCEIENINSNKDIARMIAFYHAECSIYSMHAQLEQSIQQLRESINYSNEILINYDIALKFLTTTFEANIKPSSNKDLIGVIAVNKLKFHNLTTQLSFASKLLGQLENIQNSSLNAIRSGIHVYPLAKGNLKFDNLTTTFHNFNNICLKKSKFAVYCILILAPLYILGIFAFINNSDRTFLSLNTIYVLSCTSLLLLTFIILKYIFFILNPFDQLLIKIENRPKIFFAISALVLISLFLLFFNLNPFKANSVYIVQFNLFFALMWLCFTSALGIKYYFDYLRKSIYFKIANVLL